MPKSDSEAVDAAEKLIGRHDHAIQPTEHIGRVKRYLHGDHVLPYMPTGAKQEYRHLAERAVTNWLPLISDTYAKALFVDGYRAAKALDNAQAWSYWQANGMDARQTIAHRGALEYGVSYVRVLPGDRGPSIRPLDATRSLAVYEDVDDEWPVLGLSYRGKDLDDNRLFELYDDAAVYTIVAPAGSSMRVAARELHGLGNTPLVRFRDRVDGRARGLIAPLIPLQDRINEAVFSLLIALQYASFRQRWATGLAIPDDEDGNPIEPFKAAVDRLWVTDSPDAKFGDFAQTEVSGHISAYESAVRSLAAIGQTPPHVLLGDLVNLSADALAAAESSTQRKVGEYETLFGESWEQVFRLAAKADGDAAGAEDNDAQVRWRDTEARSLAQTVDALGKLNQMLGVPAEGLWSRVPGVTDQDVEEWKAMAQKGDGLKALAAALNNNAEAGTASQTVANVPPPAPPAAGVPPIGG